MGLGRFSHWTVYTDGRQWRCWLLSLEAVPPQRWLTVGLHLSPCHPVTPSPRLLSLSIAGAIYSTDAFATKVSGQPAGCAPRLPSSPATATLPR